MSQPSASTGERFSRARRESTHEEVARHARRLWEQYGRPAGRDEQIWLEAERQLRGLDLTPRRVAERLAITGSRTNGNKTMGNGETAHANNFAASASANSSHTSAHGIRSVSRAALCHSGG